MAPLAQEVSKRLVQYFKNLPHPMRCGLRPNTADVSTFMTDYAETVADGALREAVIKSDEKFFSEDRDCPTAYKPAARISSRRVSPKRAS